MKALIKAGRIGMDYVDDFAVDSRYSKQQMKMIWRLPWWLYVGEHILKKMKKSGVLILAFMIAAAGCGR